MCKKRSKLFVSIANKPSAGASGVRPDVAYRKLNVLVFRILVESVPLYLLLIKCTKKQL